MTARTVPGRALEIRYLRSDGKRYKHTFTSPVRMIAHRDRRRVTLQGQRAIWADDEEPGFARYLRNPPRCATRRSSSGGFSLSTCVVFIIAATVASRLISDYSGGVHETT